MIRIFLKHFLSTCLFCLCNECSCFLLTHCESLIGPCFFASFCQGMKSMEQLFKFVCGLFCFPKTNTIPIFSQSPVSLTIFSMCYSPTKQTDIVQQVKSMSFYEGPQFVMYLQYLMLNHKACECFVQLFHFFLCHFR